MIKIYDIMYEIKKIKNQCKKHRSIKRKVVNTTELKPLLQCIGWLTVHRVTCKVQGGLQCTG